MPRNPPPEHSRWKKGQSGNPKGKPKGRLSLTTLLRQELEANNRKAASELAKAAIAQAKKGKGGALKEVFDRIDGTVVQRFQQEDMVRRVLEVAAQVLPMKYYDALIQALAADDGEGHPGGAPGDPAEGE